jgi:hypothetical protein
MIHDDEVEPVRSLSVERQKRSMVSRISARSVALSPEPP